MREVQAGSSAGHASEISKSSLPFHISLLCALNARQITLIDVCLEAETPLTSLRKASVVSSVERVARSLRRSQLRNPVELLAKFTSAVLSLLALNIYENDRSGQGAVHQTITCP